MIANLSAILYDKDAKARINANALFFGGSPSRTHPFSRSAQGSAVDIPQVPKFVRYAPQGGIFLYKALRNQKNHVSGEYN